MTRYNYSCVSKSGAGIVGSISTNSKDRDLISQLAMSKVAQRVNTDHIPWDPFNIELIVQAHREPKL